MAATSTLLQLSRVQWNPTFLYTQGRHHPSALFLSKPQLKSNFIHLQIACKHKQSTFCVTDARSDSNRAQRWKTSFDQIATQIKETLDSLRKPAITAVLLGLLLFYDASCAFAKSGGRIGGSAFSSRTSSPSSSSTYSETTITSDDEEEDYSYSAPSSYSYSAPSSSSSSSSTTYSEPPQKSEPPSQSESYSYSYTAPSRSYSELQQTTEPISNQFVSGLFSLALVVYVFRSLSMRSKDDISTGTEKTSVLKLQVGLLGSGRTLQEDFNRLAENADTSTLEGLSYVLTEATLALLRHPDYCISCYSSVDVKCKEEEGENLFNQLSIEERGKFDEETLVNVDSIKRQSSKIRTARGFANEYIVVTILVAAKGIQKLQPINGIEDLKEALQKLGSIPRNRIMAVEVLWTPQDENEVLSERELLEDYPLLTPF
ncbi:unnamed protein product [Microthlaspi erraticum]|uniref:Uncharacterized protein n=1 Tax=Microthlaspi erraticum TaxID=1685480 RepID=A0A6D2JNS7_9BRAS|nr:unnamed protein product [Microthlaspi erraticum]CAA7041765.1 unnamed protein product [Microthlaspi erraticum]CAA7041767.1 unnamed protein product [Microthlaspi erraticum]